MGTGCENLSKKNIVRTKTNSKFINSGNWNPKWQVVLYGDPDYEICDALLVPFHGVHYNLQEWEASGLWYEYSVFMEMLLLSS
jgi:hypothetical protein